MPTESIWKHFVIYHIPYFSFLILGTLMTLKLLQMQWVLSHVYMRSLWYICCLSIFYISFLQQMVNFNHSSNQGILLPVLLIVMKYSLSAWKHFLKIIINNWIKPILLTNPKRIGHKFYNIDACSPLLSIQHWL